MRLGCVFSKKDAGKLRYSPAMSSFAQDQTMCWIQKFQNGETGVHSSTLIMVSSQGHLPSAGGVQAAGGRETCSVGSDLDDEIRMLPMPRHFHGGFVEVGSGDELFAGGPCSW